MGLSPPRWWCELKGGRTERRRQVENQGKTRRAGRRGEKRRDAETGRCFSSTSSSSIANKIVRNYCDYGKLIYSHTEREIAFPIRKWKTRLTLQSAWLILIWLYSLQRWIWRYIIMGFMILHGKHAAAFTVDTRGVHGKRHADKYCHGRALGVGLFGMT